MANGDASDVLVGGFLSCTEQIDGDEMMMMIMMMRGTASEPARWRRVSGHPPNKQQATSSSPLRHPITRSHKHITTITTVFFIPSSQPDKKGNTTASVLFYGFLLVPELAFGWSESSLIPKLSGVYSSLPGRPFRYMYDKKSDQASSFLSPLLTSTYKACNSSPSLTQYRMNIRIDKFQRVIQYFWDPPVKNDDLMKGSIWCLGVEYSSKPKEPEGKSSDEYDTVNASSTDSVPVLLTSPSPGSADTATHNESDSESSDAAVEVHKDTSTQVDDDGWPHAFLDDFDAKFWMTYRSAFPPIPLSSTGRGNMTLATRLRSLADQEGLTSDTGWGCMIRSGQCVLANAISLLKLGRDWRRGKSPFEEQRILSLFADDPRAPFSLHNFVKYGEASCGVHPGEWFGPSATARCIQALAAQHDEGLRVYITGDGGDVYEDAFRKIAISDDGVFHPTLVLVGIRLGIERVTPVYWEALKSSLMMSQSVGIAGGRPSASHYFVGVQGQSLFYLDPHNTRPLLPYRKDPAAYTTEEVDLSHTRKLRRLHLREMDPSMLLAFLIGDERDWQAWKQGVHGKRVVHISDTTPGLGNPPGMREGAVDDVETFDDDSDVEEEAPGTS
ncbi:hypothetical protein ABW20_dc0101075 [Dactylellina cionopaga]|nr:hypothetical protein ABW20_dc0101075 [Dactylellina cionopaga]